MTEEIRRVLMKKRVITEDLSCYSRNDKAYTPSYSIGKDKDTRHYELDNHDVGVAYYDGELYFLRAYNRKWVIESTIEREQAIYMSHVMSNMYQWLKTNVLH